MRNLLRNSALGAAAALALATAANAAVVVTTLPGAPDPGPLAGEIKVITFDPGGTAPAGVTLSGDFLIRTGGTGISAPPAGDATFFLTVPNVSASGTATMNFATFLGGQDVSHFSFYWGSIDAYNTLELLNRGGTSIFTLAGSGLPPANGDQGAPATNRRVEFVLTGTDQQLGGVRFTSSSYAFESDTFSFAAIPEPASWALMILGVFGLGAVLRRQRRLAAPA